MNTVKKVVKARATKTAKASNKKISVEDWLKAYLKHKNASRTNGDKAKAADELSKLESALLSQL